MCSGAYFEEDVRRGLYVVIGLSFLALVRMMFQVIFYEQDWNPQADKQALQRAHRIGQLRSVLAINLVTENTIEEVQSVTTVYMLCF